MIRLNTDPNTGAQLCTQYCNKIIKVKRYRGEDGRLSTTIVELPDAEAWGAEIKEDDGTINTVCFGSLLVVNAEPEHMEYLLPPIKFIHKGQDYYQIDSDGYVNMQLVSDGVRWLLI